MARRPIDLAGAAVGSEFGGLAFSSPYSLEIGRTASVRATLGRDAFNGQIRVCWSRPRGTQSPTRLPFEIGAVFLPLEEGGAGSRNVLEIISFRVRMSMRTKVGDLPLLIGKARLSRNCAGKSSAWPAPTRRC